MKNFILSKLYDNVHFWPIILITFGGISTATAAAEDYRNEIGKPRVINGPMVGWVSPHEITIWARVTGDYDFSVQYDTDPDMGNPLISKILEISLNT